MNAQHAPCSEASHAPADIAAQSLANPGNNWYGITLACGGCNATVAMKISPGTISVIDTPGMSRYITERQCGNRTGGSSFKRTSDPVELVVREESIGFERAKFIDGIFQSIAATDMLSSRRPDTEAVTEAIKAVQVAKHLQHLPLYGAAT